RLGERALAAQQLGQALAREELHHHEGAAVPGLARVDDVDDVLVADRGRQPRLLDQALRHRRAGEVLVAEHLDRDLARAVAGELRLVDRAHAAFADLAGEAKAIGQRLADERIGLVGDFTHFGWLYSPEGKEQYRTGDGEQHDHDDPGAGPA